MWALIDPDDFKIYDISPIAYTHTSGAKWVEWLNFPSNCDKYNMYKWEYSKEGVFKRRFISKEDNKTKAKQLIADTDWAVLEDVDLTITSKDEYINYRKFLRDIIKNPEDGDVIWPDKPISEFI